MPPNPKSSTPVQDRKQRYRHQANEPQAAQGSLSRAQNAGVEDLKNDSSFQDFYSNLDRWIDEKA